MQCLNNLIGNSKKKIIFMEMEKLEQELQKILSNCKLDIIKKL